MPESYSPREIDQLFKASDERADAFHQRLMGRMDDFEKNTTDSLTRIEAQTTKTNGSVANLKMWRAYITGALAVLSFFIGVILLPIVSSFIQSGKI